MALRRKSTEKINKIKIDAKEEWVKETRKNERRRIKMA